MSVNGITEVMNSQYGAYQTKVNAPATDTAAEETSSKETASGAATTTNGVIYESSKDTTGASTTVNNKYANPELVAKLKADVEARTEQLRSLVTQMLTKQGTAYAQANDIWKFLAKGDFTVDPATKAQAQQDIAEDGYWGVEQTSDRIVDFAQALVGNDADKLEDMREAFKKGYAQAEETWGGKLPEISKNTYDAVMKKFDELIESNNAASENTADSTATTV